MHPTPHQHSRGWVAFSTISFVAILGMVGVGIALMPADLAMKAYMAMGTLALVQSCITLTKTLRDVHEGAKLVNRIEDARTEALLKEVGRG